MNPDFTPTFHPGDRVRYIGDFTLDAMGAEGTVIAQEGSQNVRVNWDLPVTGASGFLPSNLQLLPPKPAPIPVPVAKITTSLGGATITIEGSTADVVRAFMDLGEVDLQGLFLPAMVRNPDFTPPVAAAA